MTGDQVVPGGSASETAPPPPRRKRPPRRRHSRRRLSPAASWLQYVVFRAAVGVMRALPLGVAMRLGESVALLIHLFDRRHRQIGLINLEIAFPDRTRRDRLRILRAMWRNLGRMVAEVCHLHRLTPETVHERIVPADLERWREVMDRHGRGGALILTGHFGNWELCAYATGLFGFPVTLVYRALRNPRIDEFVGRLRQAGGTITVRKSTAGASLVNALRGGPLLVFAADQNSTRGMGTFVELFGRAASTTTGPARLALRTRMPVVPAFLVRDGRSARHRIVFGPDVEIVRTGDRDADIRENTQRFARVLEEMIARHPDHWLWMHKRWRTRPPGEPRIY